MMFSQTTIRTTSIPKIMKIHSGVWKLEVKNSQNIQFWPKNGQILAKKWPNFGLKWPKIAMSEFSRHIEYDFSKRIKRKTSIPKIRKIHSGVWKLYIVSNWFLPPPFLKSPPLLVTPPFFEGRPPPLFPKIFAAFLAR